MFFRIGILKNLANFTEKHQCWSLFKKIEGLKACNFIENRLQHRYFPVKFEHLILQNIFDGCFWSYEYHVSVL